jgi:hypothetical protein
VIFLFTTAAMFFLRKSARLEAERRPLLARELNAHRSMRTSKRDIDPTPIHAFAGACLLAAAILLPHAHLRPVLAGMALAGLIQWTWKSTRNSRHRDGE